MNTLTPRHPHELDYRRDQLARLVRLAPRFTDAVRWWAGFDIRGEQATPNAVVELDEHNAQLLDLPTGTLVLRRDLQLVATMAGPTLLVAAVTELVHEPTLGLGFTGRRTLRDSREPAELLISHLHRAVYTVRRSTDDPDVDNVALQSTAILTGAGRPALLTTDTVYWRLITHRMPETIPHYIPRPALLGYATSP